MNGDLYGGRYSQDEIMRILEISARPSTLRKPEEAFYKKSAMENEPTMAEKRELVHWLIHDSNISMASKRYLNECEEWVPKYQLRGLKYGLLTSSLTFLCFPVIRK